MMLTCPALPSPAVEPSEGPSILLRVAAGLAGAMEDCMKGYQQLVWSMARRWSGSDDEAEDAFQDIFVSLWRSAGRFDPDVGSEETFVKTIAHRRLIDRARQKSRMVVKDCLTDDIPELEAQEADGPQPDEIDLVIEALAELRSTQRLVLTLSFDQGLSHRQISQTTGIPVGSVKTHARRGMAQLRQRLIRSAC